MEGKIDLDLCGNSHLFQLIKTQSDLFVEIFHRLAEEFPHSRLLEFHHQAKGSKVSKGYRLENCPYEVLDLVRDFDPKTGFNIRILQWWGHGLYFFVQVGSANPRRSKVFSQKQVDFFISDHPDPWEYAKVLSTKKKLENQETLYHGPENRFFQMFKEIPLQEDPDKLLEDLKREILLIMDNHN
jgi:hypothetical protein